MYELKVKNLTDAAKQNNNLQRTRNYYSFLVSLWTHLQKKERGGERPRALTKTTV